MAVELAFNPYGLGSEDIVHVIIPGRGRSPDGLTLSPWAAARTVRAAAVFTELGLEAKDGCIVACGGKSPGDSGRALEDGGMSEAELMAELLVKKGIKLGSIREERQSTDSVTNLAFLERDGLLPPDEPVAIIAQAEHLDRILAVIVPKTLRRPFAGIVAPEASEELDRDTRAARTVSQLVLLGIFPSRLNPEMLAGKVDRRVRAMWALTRFLGGAHSYNQG